MSGRMVTVCSVCLRTVGAVENWSRWQAGQPAEWRVSRHRRNEQVRRGVLNTICTGTGINVRPTVIFPREVSA